MILYSTEDVACIPKRATPHSAGYDLVCAGDVTVPSKAIERISTGCRIHIISPARMGLLTIRSSISLRGLFLANGAGIIDSDYQGDLQVAVYNSTDLPITLRKHERIAQIIFVCIAHPAFKQVTEFPYETARAHGGFGSTGT